MDAIAELEERLARYPADRYPVQHATAQFHLGVVLTNAGRAEEAERALRAAVALFEPRGLRAERAKALNALGAALRTAGRPDEAITAFDEAAAGLDGVERGAAFFNLGLALRDAGKSSDAIAAFQQARELLDERAVPAQAAGAARELGTTLLKRGDVGAAIPALEEAVTLADRAGDTSGLGAAANALGLAHLARQTSRAAVDAFRRAVAAHPRSVRSREHAMAKANLALAYEQAGDPPRARLAAAQALGVHEAPQAVVDQARSLFERLGEPGDDLLAVLTSEERTRWQAVLREEVVRWADADDPRSELAAWIEVVRRRRQDATDLAEAWLGALLELPPESMERVIAAALDALDDADADWFRVAVDAASARFHTPQLLRLRDAFAWSRPPT